MNSVLLQYPNAEVNKLVNSLPDVFCLYTK